MPSEQMRSTDLTATHQSVLLLVRAALFAALTAAGALLAIPLPISPVPITLQLVFTLMAGMLLGARYGAFSQLVYVLMGVIGLPVFAKGSAGLGILLGPTGGYLIGFIAAAAVTGAIAAGVRRFTQVRYWRLFGYILAAFLGVAIMYTLGTWRLGVMLQVNAVKAVALGVVPFILPDLLKLVAAAALVVALEERGVSSAM